MFTFMNDGTVKSATRVLDLLEMLALAHEHVGVSEIARRLGIPKSSTYMLMTTLEGRGYVIGDDGRRFRLNPAFQGEGRSWVGGTIAPFLHMGRAAIQRLAEATGESSFLGITANDKAIEYVAKVVSRQDLRIDGELGVERPIHATSVGLALLASRDDAQIEKFLKGARLARLTEHTICEPAKLRRELQAIRERGYAVVRETNSLGSAGLAAPVFAADGAAVGALSIAAPVVRIDAVLASAATELLREAKTMTHALSRKSLPEGTPRVGR
jgi:DNA-binding IclR family transcriptional regulator